MAAAASSSSSPSAMIRIGVPKLAPSVMMPMMDLALMRSAPFSSQMLRGELARRLHDEGRGPRVDARPVLDALPSRSVIECSPIADASYGSRPG